MVHPPNQRLEMDDDEDSMSDLDDPDIGDDE